MPVPARMPYTYGEVDSEALPASERFVLWRETGRLPMAAEPPDHDSRRRFHIRVYKLSGPSRHFADLVATPMKLSRTKDHYNRDGLNMISLTLMLGPDVQYQFGTAGGHTRSRGQGQNWRYRVSMRFRGPCARHSTISPTLRPDPKRA